MVTANGVLDYFGQTVNIAARLQGEAHSGELVVEESLADRAHRAQGAARGLRGRALRGQAEGDRYAHPAGAHPAPAGVTGGATLPSMMPAAQNPQQQQPADPEAPSHEAEALLREIAADAGHEPERYLAGSIVPKGGE